MAGAAGAQPCRLSLTLALDVSSSVDEAEYRLQLEGIAAALRDPAVQRAILQVPGLTVVLQVFEWSGETEQDIIQDWTELRTAPDIERLATVILARTRTISGGQTALGEAIRFAFRQFDRAPDCWERKIDISGDGQSNVGIRPEDFYWQHGDDDVTVNGLAIEASVADLTRYFRNFVIHGTDAFVIRLGRFENYADAIREKLIREIGIPEVGLTEGDFQDGERLARRGTKHAGHR